MLCDKGLLAQCTCVPFWCWHRFPPVRAVYIVIAASSEVLYVGATQNLLQRWHGGRHHRLSAFRAHHGICIAWFTPLDDVFVVERTLIAQLRPSLNGQGRSEHANRMRSKGVGGHG